MILKKDCPAASGGTRISKASSWEAFITQQKEWDEFWTSFEGKTGLFEVLGYEGKSVTGLPPLLQCCNSVSLKSLNDISEHLKKSEQECSGKCEQMTWRLV